MKKLIALLLTLVLCLSLCACGKSEAAQAVEEMIDGIGEVTYESKAKLDEIEAAYESLSDKEKEEVENYDSFLAAKEAYIKEAHIYEVTVFAEKLTEVFDIMFRANTCTIDGCWSYYDQKNNEHFFTYYVCAIDGTDGRFYGNAYYRGLSDLSEETLEREITYQRAAKNNFHMVNGEFCVEYIQYGEKYALENGIELDAEQIYDYFMKKFY